MRIGRNVQSDTQLANVVEIELNEKKWIINDILT